MADYETAALERVRNPGHVRSIRSFQIASAVIFILSILCGLMQGLSQRRYSVCAAIAGLMIGIAIQRGLQPIALFLGLSRHMKHIPEYLSHRKKRGIELHLPGIFCNSLSISYRELFVFGCFPENI